MQMTAVSTHDYSIQAKAKPPLHKLGDSLFGLFIIGGATLALGLY
jgi:hypothetical protein